jgi:hypothetical protein
MKYLLIDFGASFVKIGTYDKFTHSYESQYDEISPFTHAQYLKKEDLFVILTNIINKYPSIAGVIICTILGGGYKNNMYYSWKSNIKPDNNNCLISGLFENEYTFHIHSHHDNKSDVVGLKILGMISNIPVYSSLGDTNWVIKALDLNDENVGINIGTGSQIFYKIDKELVIKKFYPAGRALLTYQELFNSLGLNIFDLFQSISYDDIINSNLQVNINVFPQSKNYNEGGNICNINEGSFNYKNLLGSLLKSLVLQYKLDIPNRNQLILTGGIINKLPVLEDIFKYYYSTYTICISDRKLNTTHRGMIKYINEYL